MSEQKPFKPSAKKLSLKLNEMDQEIKEAISGVKEPEQQQIESKRREEPIGPREHGLKVTEDIKNYLINNFAGKKGHNPYIWLGKFLTPLVKRINSGDTNAIEEVMRLELDEIDCSLKAMGIEQAEDKGIELKTEG